jgi:hypothetical protein
MHQASVPEQGLRIEPAVLSAGPLNKAFEPGTVLEAGLVLDSGIPIMARWHATGTELYKATPAWEPSHLCRLIHRIQREMRWAAGTDAKRRSVGSRPS